MSANLRNISLVIATTILFFACSKDPEQPVENPAENPAEKPQQVAAPVVADSVVGVAPAAPVPVPPAHPPQLTWADVIESNPNPKIVTNADLLQRITATGLPWSVRDRRTGIELLLVPPGEFVMGTSDADADGQNAERPAHTVIITKPFYLGRFEVTQLQWEREMNSNPSAFFDPRLPVQRVPFGDVLRFLDATGLRLPTEAEWEYACRAGSDQVRYGEIEVIARYAGNSKTRPGFVGERPANAFGFHDMLGNAMEWCSDYFQGDYYSQCKSGVTDPVGPSQGKTRVIRGGSWAGIAKMCRASYRFGVSADYSGVFLGDGFRVARNP
ncbi:MAG: formylglycine-generating enzyme family protein [Planctomycetota bacterium]|nr:formylglycine-generating enzyme family protein [Planctomycetota bacterium]MDA1261641.1 formylglycine-generating enzyme family protein [Planctomycetota bacterium]